MPILLALVLAQAGPLVTPGAAPPLPHQTQSEPLRPPRRKSAQAEPQPAPVQPCPQTADADAAIAAAQQRAAKARGTDRANAGECLGVALSRKERWREAADAFRAAQAAADLPIWRARLGAMAGEATLYAGEPAAALAAFDAARADSAGDARITGGLALFRARTLVALKREGEAEAALADARAALPEDPQAWLLSATLSRRLKKLPEAQAQIEKAAQLSPADPAIGLEAGLIAMLAGREDAARQSWQSVVTTAPDSEEAATAKSYLAQLPPAPAPKPAVSGR